MHQLKSRLKSKNSRLINSQPKLIINLKKRKNKPCKPKRQLLKLLKR